MTRSRLLTAIVLAAALAVSGCAATTTSIRYSELVVQTKMTNSIFLQPVAPDKRTIYVEVRNTTDKPLDIGPAVIANIAAKGYRVVNNPDEANFLLQAQVLQVGQTDRSALEESTAAGFGGVVGGTAIGAVLGGTRAGAGAAIGGVAVGAAEAITGSMVRVYWYSIVTDLQISQRTTLPVSQQFESKLPQGSAQTQVKQTSASASDWKAYQTRIISSARRVDLTFGEALPYLSSGLIRSISGLFYAPPGGVQPMGLPGMRPQTQPAQQPQPQSAPRPEPQG